MFRRSALTALLLLILPSFASPQSNVANISGRITTQDGAPLAAAQVSAVNLETATRSRGLSNDDGVYVLRSLRPGEYRLVVDKEGYRQIVLAGLVLSVQDSISRNFVMEIGSVVQSVTLVASGLEINASPAVSTAVNQQFVQNTPLNGRNFQALMYLIPGAVVAPYQYAPAQFSFNGQSPSANYAMVDGVSGYSGAIPVIELDHNVGRTLTGLHISGGKGTTLPVDAMQEFRVQSSSYAPEYGRTPGAQISVVTKSGTNEFHGTISDYLRNEAFDARNYFDRPPLPKPQVRQNDFGVTVGGPIIRNRTFFFFAYEGLRLQLPQTDTGDFYTATARQNVALSYVPLLEGLPVPDGSVNPDGVTAPLTVAYSDPSTFDSFNVRLDHTFSQRATIFVRYDHAPLSQWTRYWSENDRFAANTDVITVGTAMSFGGNKVNNLGVNWGHATSNLSAVMDNFYGAVPPSDSAMFPSGYTSKTSQFAMTLTPGLAGEIRQGPIINNVQTVFNPVDSFSVSVGTHQLKFGLDYRRLTPTNGAPAYSLGVVAGSYSNLQAGVANAVSTLGNATITTRTNNYSIFGQDTWQASAHLTLTYGLRWEINTPPVSSNAEQPLYAVNGIFNSQSFGLAPAGTPLYHTTFSNLAPRIGAAYRLKSDMLLRGGFGLFYDLGFGSGVAGMVPTFPYARSSFAFGAVPFDFTSSAFQIPPFSLEPNQTSSYLYAVDPNLALPLTYEWNVAYELALGANQSISATYVGAYGQRLLRQDNIQLSSSGFPLVFANHNAGWSHYNAMQLQFQRRMANGWQALVSYTLARATDTSSGIRCLCGPSGSTSGNINSVDVAADYGPSDFDVSNSLAGAVSYQFPAPHWGRAVNALLRGWQFDGILRISSAPPYNPLALAFSPVFGPYYTRPNIVPGVPFYVDDPSQPSGQRLNPAAFSVPGNGQQGNLPRNYFRAFPIDQTDIAMSRRINLTERASLYLRMEYFNIFNHPMFTPYNNIYVGSADFGKITQTLNQSLSGLNPLYQVGGPRSGQLTLKLQF